MVFMHWTFYFQIEFKFHYLCVFMYFLKILAHISVRKAFEKIAVSKAQTYKISGKMLAS